MDIYVADILDFQDHIERLAPLLPSGRQERIHRAPTTEKKLQNLCAGLLLRSLAGDRPLEYGPHGKPTLPGGPQFSLSHSGQLAVLAVSDAPVGIDVEKPRPVRDTVARRYFREDELAWMAGDEKRFFHLWTRKEAVLKCCGRGLSLSPAEFSVLPGHTPALEGMDCTLTTWEYKGHILSVASAAGDEECRMIPFLPED